MDRRVGETSAGRLIYALPDLRLGEARDLDPGTQAGLLQDVRDVGLHRPR
jgi:hypothetical protein